jgi:NADP-dependent 3-hydroxy acid dehydrogenase YdfG
LSTELVRGRKVVLVTGASSGIGEATARGLAAYGHHVVPGARRQDRLDAIVSSIRSAGGTAQARTLDATNKDDVAAFVDSAVERLGRVDVIVNNAGVMPLSRLDALLVDEWDRMVDVNVRGLLYGIAAVLPHFRRQSRARSIPPEAIAEAIDYAIGQPAGVDINAMIIRPVGQQ